ncbi:DMT family transporter [Achromobacter anxifer]
MEAQSSIERQAPDGADAARAGWAAVLAAASLWGTTGLVFQVLRTDGGADAVSISFLRLALTVPFLMSMARVYAGAWIPSLTPKGLLVLAALGVSMAFYQLTYVLAIERVGVAISVLISICGAPIFVALISVLWFREPFHIRTFAALATAVAGTILLVGLPSDLNPDTYPFWTGVAIAVVCALFQAFYVLAARAAGQVCSPMHAGGIGFAIGALVLMPFWPEEGLQLSYPVDGWLMLLYVAAVPTALAQTLFLQGIKGTGAIGGAIASLMEPLVATILAVVVLHETMTGYSVLGALILLSGIVIIQWTPGNPR